MLTPELDILKPINPSITDSDDYEIYALSNAHVVHGSNSKPANLLSAYADTPLRVEGRLEPPDRGQLKYLVKKPFKPVDVVIRNVTRFSYGQMTDGELVIWALGEAGWFEIRPRREYKTIYQDMVEAVELLYFISDIYHEPRKRGGGPSAQLIFQEYAEDKRYPCTDLEAAAHIFHKHQEFLMMCFLNKAQGIGWSNTPIYQYFRRHNPKGFETAKARIEGRYEAAAKAAPIARTSSASAPAPAQKKGVFRGKAQAKSSSDVPPKKDDNWWEAAAIYEFISLAVIKRALKLGHDRVTLDSVAKLMIKRYEIEEVETARNVLLVHAPNLIYKMEHPRGKSASFFTEEPIYRELQAGHNLPAVEIRRAEAVELRARTDQALHREMTDDSDASESDDDDFITAQRRPDGRKKRGRLSVLRPTSSKFSGKGKGLERRGKGKRPNAEHGSTSEESNADAEHGGEGDSGTEFDSCNQALLPGQGKRKFVGTSEDDKEDKDRRKRAASNSITPESPPSTSADDDDDAEADNETPIPIRYRATRNPKTGEPIPKSNVVPPIVSSPLPTYEANGPRDSWMCNFDGCSQRIYGVSKELGQQLVTEHLEDHAKGREEVVGIVWREEEKLRLPVNNLLKKIREMSEAKTPLFPSSEVRGARSALQPQLIRRVV